MFRRTFFEFATLKVLPFKRDTTDYFAKFDDVMNSMKLVIRSIKMQNGLCPMIM
ncbi:uncharacterized protein METZ01_LOCUS8215 [marine metagenome]|uniref:Uncharacterized protein n=1 Tax=marine metagenome TaxID=408172 RepID=A0A381NLA2_9ZZZZ